MQQALRNPPVPKACNSSVPFKERRRTKSHFSFTNVSSSACSRLKKGKGGQFQTLWVSRFTLRFFWARLCISVALAVLQMTNVIEPGYFPTCIFKICTNCCLSKESNGYESCRKIYRNIGKGFTESGFMRKNKTSVHSYSAVYTAHFFNAPRNIWENVKVISWEYIQYPLLPLKSHAETPLPKIAS